jgi:hypothetical protein
MALEAASRQRFIHRRDETAAAGRDNHMFQRREAFHRQRPFQLRMPSDSLRLVASSVLCEAVAEGPILFRDFDKVHEHVLRPEAGAFPKQLGDPQEQRRPRSA